MLDFKQYQRLFCWVRKPPAWTVGVKAFDLVQAPSFNAGTNSLRKEKGVCGKNLCGVFLRDFHQPAAAFPLCRWQRGNAKKRDRQCLSLFLAEKEGFEPSRPFRGLHDFQSCALDQLGDFSIAAGCSADMIPAFFQQPVQNSSYYTRGFPKVKPFFNFS